MDEIFGTRYICEMRAGNAKPVLIEANDKNKYVVKFKGNRIPSKILINDMICSRLAEKIDLPVPRVTTIAISQELIDIEPELQKEYICEGEHFGSYFYPDTVNFIGEKSLLSVCNIDQIPRIVAFDLWVGNDDRADNEGNLLITTSFGQNKIIAIDYGNSFNGPDWDLNELMYGDIYIPPFEGSVYSCLRNYINGNNPFNNICDEIENLSYYDIDTCTFGLPQSWGLNDTFRKLIVDFLDRRKKEIRETLNDIKLYFPNWR